ncbi:MAG: metalloregulator ArsR/SmtB family transcription factor [Bacilli bacterium]|jgi:ArsR family transcriptional regulator|nr:metalloregulator ArsR/SmtB family transcription factor [Bacilli bacterium]
MKCDYEKYALIFKALSDETRLKIVSMLSDKELCACKILEAFNITQPTLSYHMKLLVDTNLVNAVKNGSWVNYSINEESKEELLMFLSQLLKAKCTCEKRRD